jgi:hypothetical protein
MRTVSEPTMQRRDLLLLEVMDKSWVMNAKTPRKTDNEAINDFSWVFIICVSSEQSNEHV